VFVVQSSFLAHGGIRVGWRRAVVYMVRGWGSRWFGDLVITGLHIYFNSAI